MTYVGSNIVLVVKAFQDKINEILPGVKWYFSPQSPDVQEGFRTLRIAKLRQLVSEIQDVPCIVWHRNPLQPFQAFDARSSSPSLYPSPTDATKWDIYGTCQGTFALDCAFASNSMADIEVFEVAYNSLIFHMTQIEVAFESPIDRSFQYQCEFDQLSAIDYIPDRGVYSVGFEVRISGFWFLLDTSYPKLEKIIGNIYFPPSEEKQDTFTMKEV